MPNIRKFDTNEWQSLSGAYLTENIKKSKQPVMLILGTSFSYGLDLKTKETYSNFLVSYFPHHKVMNASVIGDSGETIFDKINYLKRKKIVVDSLIIEINLFNFTSTKKFYTDTKAINFPDSITNSFFDFYLFHPHGIHSFANLEISRLMVLKGERKQPYTQLKLQDNYVETYSDFNKKLPMYQEFLTVLLDSSKQVANNVYFFVSPIYGNAIVQSQFNFNEVQNELLAINSICEQISSIHCLSPGFQFTEDNFMNIVHFNSNGHKQFAQWLSQKIQA